MYAPGKQIPQRIENHCPWGHSSFNKFSLFPNPLFLLILYFLLAVGVSFICSILEAVFLSITPSFVASRQKEGAWIDRKLEQLKWEPDQPLAAILTLNTIAHTVGAAGVGAQAQLVFQNLPFSIISGVLTLLILVFSEIIPKTLGATFWRALSMPSIAAILLLTWLLWPFVKLSSLISHLLAPRGAMIRISREEVSSMADLGFNQGIFDKSERKALRNLIQFRQQTVKSILTPRVVTLVFPGHWTVSQVMEAHEKIPFSRIPLMGDAPDEILGYVMKADILQAAARDQHERPIREWIREVIVVPESVPIWALFQRFLKSREHLAVVVDEYGNFAGVVTLEDLIETMIGHEIMDEQDSVEDLRAWASSRQGNSPG